MFKYATSILLKLYRVPAWIVYSAIYAHYFIVSFWNLDPDFGWHYKTGENIYNNGFLKLDLFTYTASDFPFVSHEWLHDTMVYLLMNVGGYLLLASLFAGLWTFSIIIASKPLSPIIAFVGAISMTPYVGVRTSVWVAFFVAILVLLLNKKKYLFLIPVLFFIWVQLHGSFIFGFVLMGYYTIFHRSLKLLAILILSIGFTFINPYGWSVYLEIASIITDSSLRWRISEWSLLTPSFYQTVYIVLFVVALFVAHPKACKRFLDLSFLLLVAAFSSQRHYILFVIVSLFHLRNHLLYLSKYINYKKISRRYQKAYIAGGCIIVFIFMTYYIFFTLQLLMISRDRHYPQKQVEFLKNYGCKGNIFNSYDFGGYLIWQLPQYKVYIDGRMASWVHNERKYMDDYINIVTGSVDYKPEFERYNVGCAILYDSNNSNDRMLRDSLIKDGWSTAVTQDNIVLLIKP